MGQRPACLHQRHIHQPPDTLGNPVRQLIKSASHTRYGSPRIQAPIYTICLQPFPPTKHGCEKGLQDLCADTGRYISQEHGLSHRDGCAPTSRNVVPRCHCQSTHTGVRAHKARRAAPCSTINGFPAPRQATSRNQRTLAPKAWYHQAPATKTATAPPLTSNVSM